MQPIKRSQNPVLCVIGSINIDYVFTTPKFPLPGETLIGNSFSTYFGGKGANQAVMASLLGSKVFFIGAVGNDDASKSIRQNFQIHKVNTQHIYSKDCSSGAAMVAVTSSGENCIIVAPGANHLLTSNDSLSALNSLFVHNEKVVALFQNEVPHKTILDSIKHIRKNHGLCIYNPAPSSTEREAIESLQLADIVIVNQTECYDFCNYFDKSNTILIKQKFQGISILKELLLTVLTKHLSALHILVTIGAAGTLLYSAASEQVKHIPASAVDHIVDTTGAGDAFCGAFASYLSHHPDQICSAVKFANRVASASIEYLGAQSGYPKAAERFEIASSTHSS